MSIASLLSVSKGADALATALRLCCSIVNDMTINRIGPVSCAKIAGLIYAALGLLAGAVVTFIALLGMAVSGTQQSSPNSMSAVAGGLIGIAAIVVFPIFYGLLGFLIALIGAWIYNVAASKVGGVEIEVVPRANDQAVSIS